MSDLDTTPAAFTATPTQDLLLEVLAARHRLGEFQWPFDARHTKSLNDLAAAGYLTVMHGTVEKTIRASLTPTGMTYALDQGYEPPRHVADDGREDASELIRAARTASSEQRGINLQYAGANLVVIPNDVAAKQSEKADARAKELEAERNDYRERLVAADRAYAKKSAAAEGYKAALEAAEAQNRAERNAVTARLAEEAARADLVRAAAEYSESKNELFEARTAAARARAAVEAEAEAETDDMCIDDICDTCEERHPGTCEEFCNDCAAGMESTEHREKCGGAA